jgi:outer membrane protein
MRVRTNFGMTKILNRTAVVIALWITAGSPAWASGLSVDILPNFVGLGVGVTTEWMGSNDKIAGVVPGGRMKFSDYRFAEVYGPLADVNILNVPHWEFGPMLSYRFGRGNVQDPVVNKLPGINGGLEAGGFAGFNYTNIEGVPWRLRMGVSVIAGVSGGATGSHVTPYASLWLPLSPRVFVGLGSGTTWSSSSFVEQRFGVTPAQSAASGLPVYTAGSGIRQIYAWPAVIVKAGQHWFVGAGMFYQRLTGDAANSPIVTQRGNPNQFTAGAGIAYVWD